VVLRIPGLRRIREFVSVKYFSLFRKEVTSSVFRVLDSFFILTDRRGSQPGCCCCISEALAVSENRSLFEVFREFGSFFILEGQVITFGSVGYWFLEKMGSS